MEPNANDVYKLHVVHNKVPFLDYKEVKRRVFDGQILDSINNNVVHLEIDGPTRPSDDDNKESPRTQHSLSHSKSYIKNNSFPAIPEVPTPVENTITSDSSEDSFDSRSTDGQDIISAKIKIERHESSDYYEKMNVEFSENNTKQPETFVPRRRVSEPFVNEEVDVIFAPSSPTAQISSLASEKESMYSRSIAPSNIARPSVPFLNRRVVIKKKGNAINKNITPSPTFFYSVSDLFERLKHRKKEIVRSDSVNIILAVAHMQQENQQGEDVTKSENVDDDSASDSSASPQDMKSLLSFEPPIMVEKKARYLGVPPPEVGSLGAFVCRESATA